MIYSVMFNLILFILLSFFIAFCGSSVKQRESMPTTNDVSVLNQSWNLKIESDISEALKSLDSPIANSSSTYILNSLKKLSLEINRCNEKFRQSNLNLISSDSSQLAQFRFNALINTLKNADEQTVEYAPNAFETVTSAIECCLASVAVSPPLPVNFNTSYVQKLETAKQQLAKAFIANSLKKTSTAELALQNARNIVTTLKNPYLFYELSLFEGLKYFENAHYAKAIEQFKNALNFLDDIPNSNYQKATVLYNLGRIRQTLAQYGVALENLEKAINFLEKGSLDNYFLFTNILRIQSWLYSDMGHYDESIRFLETALSIKKQYSKIKDLHEANILNDLGSAHSNLGEHEKAIRYYAESLLIRRAILGESNVGVAITLSNIGTTWNMSGKYELALEYHHDAYVILNIINDRNTSLALVLNEIGVTESNLGQYYKAMDDYKSSLEILLENFGEKHPDIALVYSNIGENLQSMGEYKKAIEFYEKALTIYRFVFGYLHPKIAVCINNIGTAYYEWNKYGIAANYLREALKMEKQLPFVNERNIAENLMSLGHTLRNLGRIDEAVSKYEEALILRRKYYSEENPLVSIVKRWIIACNEENRKLGKCKAKIIIH